MRAKTYADTTEYVQNVYYQLIDRIINSELVDDDGQPMSANERLDLIKVLRESLEISPL